ncbi:sulfite exporter TauE/SafE family protein [Isoalcanivorax beigongshangi]|uniref:Probable membrane transporter protein n=1 Tax=Isoalcanivorax beigongshangi TaxID=3238810 RepID=A0ABV4AMH5_9GAMM
MSFEYLPAYLGLGVIAGLLGGALGLGGGVVLVPGLLLILHWMGVPIDVATQTAVATSLATIVLTSTSAIRAHHSKGNVRWEIVSKLAVGILLGAFAGAFVADWLSGPLLAQLFGGFAVLVALQMLFSSTRPEDPAAVERLPGPVGLTACGGIIGVLSSLFGIGGGSLTVPMLNAFKVPMRQAVAVSSACGFPIAVAGCTGFIIAGWGDARLPTGSFGYVFLPAALGIGIASYPMAKVGAQLATLLPAATLKRVFALLLVIIGVRLALG